MTPTLDEVEAMSLLTYGSSFASLGSIGREKIVELVIAAKQVDALLMIAAAARR